jgi:hypothetical protein
MLIGEVREELAIHTVEQTMLECMGIRPLAENLRRIEAANEELTPLSVRISSDMRQRLERLIGHLPKRKRAQVLRALLEHAISAAEVQGCGGAVPD